MKIYSPHDHWKLKANNQTLLRISINEIKLTCRCSDSISANCKNNNQRKLGDLLHELNIGDVYSISIISAMMTAFSAAPLSNCKISKYQFGTGVKYQWSTEHTKGV